MTMFKGSVKDRNRTQITRLLCIAGLLVTLAPLLSVQVPGVSSDAVQSSIPGIPGRDYPTLATVPPTLFSCRAQVIFRKY